MSILRSQIVGCGSYLPARIVTNAELAERVDTTDEWIVQRTGIRQRHIAADDEATSTLGLKAAMSRSLMAKIGYLFARGAFAALKDKMDPRKVNGGVFLGLEGIVIKSHGGTDAVGFASATELGYEMAREDLMAKVREMVAASARQEASMQQQAAAQAPAAQ